MEYESVLDDDQIRRILDMTAVEVKGRWYRWEGDAGGEHSLGSNEELFARIRAIADESILATTISTSDADISQCMQFTVDTEGN